MRIVGIRSRLAVLAAVAATLAGTAPHPAAGQPAPEECNVLWGALQSAAKAGDVKAAAAAEREIGTDPGCNAHLGVAAKQAVLALYREQDGRLEKAGAAPEQRLALLMAALRYGNAWNAWDIHAKIGDLRRRLPDARGQLDHAAISLAYDAAVRAIDNAPAAARPPPAVVARVVRLAFQFEALAAAAVATRGRLTRTARQVNVLRTPVPLQFEYDSDVLTEAGRAQAENLLQLLKEEDMPPLHLVGHTDPVGSDAYNDRLSLRRAAAIRSFLVARGYPAERITTEGRGKRDIDKITIEDRASFTEAQIHQMLRRVELVWR